MKFSSGLQKTNWIEDRFSDEVLLRLDKIKLNKISLGLGLHRRIFMGRKAAVCRAL
jgi:hypothetical protein